GNGAAVYAIEFKIDTRKDLNKSDLKPKFIQQMRHEARQQLQHSYDLLKPQVERAHAAYHKSLPPRDSRGDDFNPESFFAGVDESLKTTFKYLRNTGMTTELRPFLRALASPYEDLSQSLKSEAGPKGKPEKHDPDELDGHQQELAGLTHIFTDQGSGMLTAMGLKHRIALRGPLMTQARSNTDNMPETDAVIAVNYKKDGVKRALTLPVIVDRSEAPTFYASQITDEIAHMHGHKNTKAMRKSLRIGDNENPILYSYAYRLTAPEELIWHDQAAEDIVMNMVQSFHDIWAHSDKDSVRSAKNFLKEQVSAEDQQKGLERITPFREIRGTEHAERLAAANRAGNGRPPQASVAFRSVNSVQATDIDFGPEHERLRALLREQKSTGRG
ncbi:MAG: hypothetical protein ACOYJ2_00640, partial [Rickettsiales bacterium]